MMRFLLAALSLLFFSECARGAEPAPLDPDAPYTAERLNPVTYDVDYQVIVTAPYKTKLLKVWLPIPPSDAGQEVRPGELTTFPQVVTPRMETETMFGNRFAYFEFAAPQGAQIIRHRFQITVWELRWHLEPAKVERTATWPATFDKFRRSEAQAVVVGDKHRTLAAELAPRSSNPADELASIMGYAQRTFTYDHVVASLRGDSEHAMNTGRGHCSDYHGFCAAVGRALGYPTRITYGINTFPKNSPSHCKLEAFLPPYGWVSFDVSETQKLTAAIAADGTLDAAAKMRLAKAALERLQSGFRDNTWFVQTRGSDYELAPKASAKVPVVRTIYAEADGKPLADPDPANPNQREYAWMVAVKISADRAAPYPFQDVKSFEQTRE